MLRRTLTSVFGASLEQVAVACEREADTCSFSPSKRIKVEEALAHPYLAVCPLNHLSRAELNVRRTMTRLTSRSRPRFSQSSSTWEGRTSRRTSGNSSNVSGAV